MWRHIFLSIRPVHRNSPRGPEEVHTTPYSSAHCQLFIMSESKRRKSNGSSHSRIPSTPDLTPRNRKSPPPAPDDVPQSQDGSESEASTTADRSPAEVTKSFQELGIIDSLCDACKSLGYTQPTPIQREAIPLALQGKDVSLP